MSDEQASPKKRGYHHGDLRRALLSAAAELVSEAGPEGFSVRELARRTGVSAAAPYRHFKDAEAILLGVALEAEARFFEEIERHLEALSEDRSAMEQLRAYGQALVRFASDHPTFFRLMGHPRLQELRGRHPDPPRRRVHAELKRLTRAALEEGALKPNSPRYVGLTLLAVTTGLAQLAASGALGRIAGEDDPVTVTAEVMRLVDLGLCEPSKMG